MPCCAAVVVCVVQTTFATLQPHADELSRVCCYNEEPRHQNFLAKKKFYVTVCLSARAWQVSLGDDFPDILGMCNQMVSAVRTC